MTSLFTKAPASSTEKARSLPPEMRQLIVDLKAEFPDFHLREQALFDGVELEQAVSAEDAPVPYSWLRVVPKVSSRETEE